MMYCLSLLSCHEQPAAVGPGGGECSPENPQECRQAEGTWGSDKLQACFTLKSTRFLQIFFTYFPLLGYAFLRLGDALNLNV